MERDLKCAHCERFMGKAYGTIIATLKCPNSACKGETQFKIVTADISKALTFEFNEVPAEPKKKEVKE